MEPDLASFSSAEPVPSFPPFGTAFLKRTSLVPPVLGAQLLRFSSEVQRLGTHNAHPINNKKYSMTLYLFIMIVFQGSPGSLNKILVMRGHI